jgi:hypothetical protein
VLIVDVDDMDELAPSQVAVFAAMNMPKEILKDVRQALWATAKQSNSVVVPTVQMAGLEARVWTGQWADKATLNTLGDHNRDSGRGHSRAPVIVNMTLYYDQKRGGAGRPLD